MGGGLAELEEEGRKKHTKKTGLDKFILSELKRNMPPEWLQWCLEAVRVFQGSTVVCLSSSDGAACLLMVFLVHPLLATV